MAGIDIATIERLERTERARPQPDAGALAALGELRLLKATFDKLGPDVDRLFNLYVDATKRAADAELRLIKLRTAIETPGTN